MTKIDFSQRRFLIVDDQRPFLALLKGVLKSVGVQHVVSAKSCELALASCKKAKFDFIICDLHLGANRKNGFELLEELREKALLKPDTVFVIISADSQRPMVLGSLEKQPDEFVVKPFSQAQLVLRLEKAFARRTALAPIYKHIYAKDYLSAIAVCKQIIQADDRYKELVGRLLSELYWRTKQFDLAKDWLNSYQENNKRTWLTVSKAQTELLLKNHTQAITLAKEALNKNKLLIEAHDIIAQSWFELDNDSEAEVAINQALRLSPFSVERQFKACQYARRRGNFEKIIGHSQTIWDCSKKSVHRNLAYLCGHVRSFLDVAERAEDPKSRLRFQQEALYTLQRYRHNENMSKQDDDFDFDIFENVIKARIDCQNGKPFNAKQILTLAQKSIAEKFESYPGPLAPDSIVAMLELGEFDDAQELSEQLAEKVESLDQNTQALLEHSVAKNQTRKDHYHKYNQQGIALYAEGKFEAAYDAFTEAQTAVPVNIGITLNLLQCSLRLMQKTAKPEPKLVQSSKKIYRQLINMTMLEKHQQKFDLLKIDLEKILDIK